MIKLKFLTMKLGVTGHCVMNCGVDSFFENSGLPWEIRSETPADNQLDINKKKALPTSYQITYKKAPLH